MKKKKEKNKAKTKLNQTKKSTRKTTTKTHIKTNKQTKKIPPETQKTKPKKKTYWQTKFGIFCFPQSTVISKDVLTLPARTSTVTVLEIFRIFF